MKEFHFSFTLGFLAVILPAAAFAGHPSVPGGAATEGSGSSDIVANTQGTFQNLYRDLGGGLGGSGLRVGDTITGISLRLDSSVSSFSGIFFDRFDIQIGLGNANLVTALADNFSGAVTQARTGPLTLLSADMPITGAPRSFGKVIKFDTPYVYGGGNLIIETRVKSFDSFTIDTVDTTNKAGIVTNDVSANATTGTITVGPAWSMAFEVIREGKPVLATVNIPNGAIADGDEFSSWGVPYTFQYLYPAAALPNLDPGDQICGFCLRLDQSDTSSGSATYGRFDVKIGQAAATFQNGSGSLLADNFASPPTMARSGPLTLILPAATTNPRPFGSFVAFEAPYTYTGGDLVIEWRVVAGNALNTLDYNSGTDALGFGADATTSNGDFGSVPVMQLKVIKPALAGGGRAIGDVRAVLKLSLNNKIKKLKKKIKKTKKSGSSRKVKSLKGKLKKLQKQLKAL